MTKYDYVNYCNFTPFIDYLPQHQKEQFQTIISWWPSGLQASLQALLNTDDTASWSVAATVVIHHASRLQSSKLPSVPTEVQNIVENHRPFEAPKLFINVTNESLHSLKDSRATLCSLDIDASVTKMKFSRS